MATNYPGGTDTFTQPAATQPLSNGHYAYHTNTGDAIVAIETELGTGPSGSSANVAARLDALTGQVAGNRRTSSYTLVLADAGKAIEMNSSSANNLTIPTNTSVAFPTGTAIEVLQYGAGATTVVAASGVTLQTRGTTTNVMAGQWGIASLRKTDSNIWVLSGDIV